MPKNTRNIGTRKNRRVRKPNVFVQSQSPQDDDESTQIEADSPPSTIAASRPRARVERTTQRAGVRSEIYTRSLSSELRKMGALSAMVVVVLLVLTFTL
jgi:hypothetical protein